MQSANPNEVVTPSLKLTEGQQVGGCFLLKREILQSRGVSVWLAQDEVLGKEVTLHFVPEAVCKDERALAELRQEVKRNRQLIHPNILRVYDLVEDGALVAVAMDRFEGELLAEVLKQKGAFDGEEIKPWIQQIGETLGDAHRIQLIHRDLAPANFLARQGGSLLLMNFGLSRVIGEAMERAGLLKGEATHLSYLSPQQIDGERPAPSDDVYGLGVLAHELLTGRPPFSGEGVLAAIRKNPPPSVNEARASLGRKPVSAAWERFISACMAKSADQRPKSCAEALSLLQEKGAAEVVPPVVESKPLVAAAALPVNPAPEKAPEKAPAAAIEPPKTSISNAVTKSSAAPIPQLPPTPPGGTKGKPLPALASNYPDLERPKSKMPLIGLGVAASILAAALYFKSETATNTGVGSAVSRVEDSGNELGVEPGTGELPLPLRTDGGEIVAAGTPAASEALAPVPEIASTSETPEPAELIAAADTSAAKPEGRGLIGADSGNEAAKPPVPKVRTPASPADAAAPAAGKKDSETARPSGIQAIPLPPAPEPLPKLSIPQNPDPQQLAKLLAEREAAAEKFAEAASAAERVHTANAQLREIREEDLEAQKKAMDAKKKSLAPVLKAAADFDAEKKRIEENMAKTEAAAKEAARAAEAAKKSYEDLLAKSTETIAAKEKAETELSAVTQAVTEGNKQVEELSTGASKAEAQKQQMLAAKKQAEQEIQQLTSALDKATKAHREAMVKANRPKINALEAQIKDIDEQLERYKKAVASLEALKDDSTNDAIRRIEEKIKSATEQKAEHEEEIKRLSGLAPVTPPAPTEKPATPAGAAAKPAEAQPAEAPVAKPVATPETKAAETKAAPVAAPAMIAKVDPVKPPDSIPESDSPKAGTNSVGMSFARVGDVEFGVHLVTRKAFEEFSKSTGLKPEHWRNPGFEQTPDHPVVNVTWKEADAFCKWLTQKERKAGLLKANESYRLPTDLEWSKAVGLPQESGATPEDRDMRIEDVYPWGTQWPPPPGAGNFAGEETVTELPIEGYNDKFPNTSPVGAFRPNANGLFDMGGNVWQWVQDSFDGVSAAKTLRGGSWYNGAIKMSLLSSCRIKSSPETINDTYGFRVVRATDAKAKQ